MPKPASPKQKTFLRSLSSQRGVSFTPPKTAMEAHREIERIKGLPRTAAGDILRERRGVSADLAERADDATRIRDHETTGYGSTARWA